MPTMLVHDVMSATPVVVSPATRVSELLTLFDRHDYNAFPVVDDRAQVVGVVSKLDVLRAFLGPQEVGEAVVADTPAEALMTPDVLAVGPEDSLRAAGERMAGAKLHSLPVVEEKGGKRLLVGVVSRGDILRGLRYRLDDAGNGLRP